MGRWRERRGLMAIDRKMGYVLVCFFSLKEKNIHSETHKSQPHSRKAISNPLQGGRRCQVRLILLTILY